MIDGTIELSISEAVIVHMGLKMLMEANVKPIDKRIAEEVDQRIRIIHKGQKIRMMLFTNEGILNENTNLKR